MRIFSFTYQYGKWNGNEYCFFTNYPERRHLRKIKVTHWRHVWSLHTQTNKPTRERIAKSMNVKLHAKFKKKLMTQIQGKSVTRTQTHTNGYAWIHRTLPRSRGSKKCTKKLKILKALKSRTRQIHASRLIIKHVIRWAKHPNTNSFYMTPTPTLVRWLPIHIASWWWKSQKTIEDNK